MDWPRNSAALRALISAALLALPAVPSAQEAPAQGARSPDPPAQPAADQAPGQEAETLGESYILYSGKRLLLLGLVAEAQVMEARGYHYDAAVSLAAVLESGEKDQPYYLEAELSMGRNLLAAGLYYCAFLYYSAIVERGPESPAYLQTIEPMATLLDKLPGLDAVRETVARYDPAVYPPDLASQLAFAAATVRVEQEELDAAQALLGRVRVEDAEWYAKARYLLGTLHARRNKARESLDAFKDVLRVAAGHQALTPTLREMRARALLAVARIFYSTGDYQTALRYYAKLDRLSNEWMQALFETSWSMYRLGRFDKALGNLQTLTSPYYADGFFPESYVVEAVILFTNCHYEEAVVAVDALLQDYEPLLQEMQVQLAAHEDPADFYRWLASLAGSRGKQFSARLKRIFNVVAAEKKVRRRMAVIPVLDSEKKYLERYVAAAPQCELARSLLQRLDRARDDAVVAAGELAWLRLDERRRELKRQIVQAMRVKYEALIALKKELEGTASSRAQAEGPRFAPKNPDEYLAWPFEGEYWRDELDAYSFHVTNLCNVEGAPAPSDTEVTR